MAEPSSEEVQKEIQQTLDRLQRLFDDNPDSVAQFVTGPTRITEEGEDVASALGVVIASSFLEQGAGKWVLLQEFNTPETLYYAVHKMVGTPGLSRTMVAGQAVYVGNEALKLLVTLQREVDETVTERARCEAIMDSVAEKMPVNVPRKYSPSQIDPEDIIRVEQFIDEMCELTPGAKTRSGAWCDAYSDWASARGYPRFGGGRNGVLRNIVAHVIDKRELNADARAGVGNTNYIIGIVVKGVHATATRSIRRSDPYWNEPGRGRWLPDVSTIDGLIYEHLAEYSPNCRTTHEIYAAVRDKRECEESSVHNRCSQMAAEGLISKGPWGAGYFLPALVE